MVPLAHTVCARVSSVSGSVCRCVSCLEVTFFLLIKAVHGWQDFANRAWRATFWGLWTIDFGPCVMVPLWFCLFVLFCFYLFCVLALPSQLAFVEKRVIEKRAPEQPGLLDILEFLRGTMLRLL